MATSGTVGLTTIDVTQIIEHAARRCTVLAPAIPAEVQLSARENLFMILTQLAVQGMALWCIHKTVYALAAGASDCTLDLGIEEVLNALCRTGIQNPGALAAGTATYSPTTAAQVYGVNLGVPQGTYTFVTEGSPDGVTWKQYGTKSVTLTAQGNVCYDNEPSATLLFWRVRETVAGTVVFYSAGFVTNANEVEMSVMSRDDYAALPNKFAQGRPLQYWYRKKFPQQQLKVWQVPADSTTYQAVVWARRQIQDVGALSNTLELPQRWLNAVISQLAPYVCLELPSQMVPTGRYEILVGLAADTLGAVLDAEVDGAPVRIDPGIRGYTR